MRKHLLLFLAILIIGMVALGCIYESADTRLMINQVSAQQFHEELVALHEIGPVLAKRCVDYRTEHGTIKVRDLEKVKGIGPVKLKEIKKRFKDG